MTRREREQQKQLLLLKGEVLRTQLQLDLLRWRKPAHVLQQGMGWFSAARLGSVGLLLIRNSKWRRWLRIGIALAGIWRFLRHN